MRKEYSNDLGGGEKLVAESRVNKWGQKGRRRGEDCDISYLC